MPVKTQNPWTGYWADDPFWSGPGRELLEANARIFLMETDPILSYRAEDDVCDIGCGLGLLANLLAPRVRSVTGVDTSARALAAARDLCQNHDNTAFVQLGEPYTDLSVAGRTFSLFICNSTVQYYRSVEEILDLIASARRCSRPGARMIISDLPRARGMAGRTLDGALALAKAARGGYAAALIRTAWQRIRDNPYRRAEQATQPLAFTRADVDSLAAKSGLQTTIWSSGFSIHPNRFSMLFRFP